MTLFVTPGDLPGLLDLQPRASADDRGFFYESFNARAFERATKLHRVFVQDNHSKSLKNVLRGLHYQIAQPQGKLIRVLVGEVFDVAVDLRRSSLHFGRWSGITVSAESRRQRWIPEGFAHGFLVLSEVAEVLYKTTDYWAPAHERCIRWDDPTLAIAWPVQGIPKVSRRDGEGIPFNDAQYFD